DANLDIARQVSAAEDFMARGIDVLIITPVNEEGVVPILRRARANGTPVVLEGNPVVGMDTLVAICDYDTGYHAGVAAGQYVNENLGGEARVMNVGLPLLSATVLRSQGFMDGIRTEVPDAELVHDLDGGAIEIDGQSLANVAQESLRGQIGMVTQDTSLLHRSILDNIRYGRPDASLEEVMAAARQAQAEEFIHDLVDWKGRRGYEAHVGERGVKLSGGQRQRVAIARVILKDAPILILDEATSALDSEIEAAIQEQLSDLMAGKTVIAIAHRLSTIAQMDRLLVMQEGEIIEDGSHPELLARGGLYADLWSRQSGGFLAESA
ncbi:MAG: ATP-binding cassette domain-containing protein, partial [Pseudomonadota bacterium]